MKEDNIIGVILQKLGVLLVWYWWGWKIALILWLVLAGVETRKNID